MLSLKSLVSGRDDFVSNMLVLISCQWRDLRTGKVTISETWVFSWWHELQSLIRAEVNLVDKTMIEEEQVAVVEVRMNKRCSNDFGSLEI